jgi:hypothetical protein
MLCSRIFTLIYVRSSLYRALELTTTSTVDGSTIGADRIADDSWASTAVFEVRPDMALLPLARALLGAIPCPSHTPA